MFPAFSPRSKAAQILVLPWSLFWEVNARKGHCWAGRGWMCEESPAPFSRVVLPPTLGRAAGAPASRHPRQDLVPSLSFTAATLIGLRGHLITGLICISRWRSTWSVFVWTHLHLRIFLSERPLPTPTRDAWGACSFGVLYTRDSSPLLDDVVSNNRLPFSSLTPPSLARPLGSTVLNAHEVWVPVFSSYRFWFWGQV